MRVSYKKTQIGEIPEEWEVVKLGDEKICKKIKAGGTPLRTIKKYYENGTIPFVRIEDITKSRKYLNDTELKITELGLKNSSTWLVPENSILFSMYASYGEVTINKIPVTTNQAIIAIIPQELSDVEYFYYALSNLKTELYRYLRETTQKNLNAEIVTNLIIPFPPSVERRKIASILSTIDETVQKTDEIIRKIQELKRGLMQQLLTRGIGHKEFKRTEIGKIPEEWDVVTLEDVLSQPPQYGLSVKLFSKGNYPILKMDNLEDGRAVIHELKYANIDKKLFDQFKLEKEDILFNRTNAFDLVGRVGIFLLNGDFTFASYLIRLKISREKADPCFVNYYLNADFTQRRLKTLATRGVSQANINAKNLKSFLLPRPPIPEQRKIASTLSAVDEKIEKERQRKEQLEKLKKGLMQDLLTGRVRVKVD
jgi:type I restriction enzyme S subunit